MSFAMTASAKTYWLDKIDIMDTFLKDDDWSDKAVSDLIAHTPLEQVKIDCQEAQVAKNDVPMWIDFIQRMSIPLRALKWWLDEKPRPYLSEESRLLRCQRCPNFKVCQETKETADKMKLCLDFWQQTAADFRNKVGVIKE